MNRHQFVLVHFLFLHSSLLFVALSGVSTDLLVVSCCLMTVFLRYHSAVAACEEATMGAHRSKL